MMESLLFQKLLYPPPPSTFVTIMTVLSFVAISYDGLKETKGIHVQYSKFWNVKNTGGTPQPNQQLSVPSRIGMLIGYTPAFVFGAASFFIFPDEGLRFFLVRLALTIHFLKRVLEVLFVHKYTGRMALEAAGMIPVSYLCTTATMIYAQHLSRGFPEPSVDLKYVGVVLFVLGISGNFYHHWVLANLRGKGQKEYMIPKGGLFSLVICPHYLFEVLGFVGLSCITQTLFTLCFTLGSFCYLMCRSYATRRWYLSKFEDFPTGVKAMIPYVF